MNFTTLFIFVLFTTFVAVLAGDYTPTVAEEEILKQSPCSDTDTVCWALKCNEYLNAIRKENDTNLHRLELANVYMLDNAVEHSIRQANVLRKIFHQDPLPKLGEGECVQQVNGENVATSWGTEGRTNNNYAYQCVGIQWRHSPGHYENMVRASFKSSITGIYVSEFTNERGYKMKRITCTQTFATRSFANGVGKCAAVSAGTNPTDAAPSSEPSPSTTPESETPFMTPTPTMDPIDFDDDKTDDDHKKADCSDWVQTIPKIYTNQTFRATFKDGTCQYCLATGGCLSPSYSERINEFLSS